MRHRHTIVNVLKHFCSIIDKVSVWTGKIVSFAIVILMSLIVCEVVSRYLFNSSIIWIHETSLFLYATAGLVAGAYTSYYDVHVKTDIVYAYLSDRGKAVIDLITSLLFFFFCALLIWKGTEEAIYSFQSGERSHSIWAPPLYPIKMVLPLSALLLLLQGIASFIRNIIFIFSRSNS